MSWGELCNVSDSACFAVPLHGLHYEEKFKKEREDLIEAKRKEKEDKEKKREEMKRIVEEEKQRRKEEKERMKAEKERVSWKVFFFF